MRMKEYSSGYHAQVFHTNERQQMQFGADLLRVESSIKRRLYAELFYKHKIAGLLFPDTFIDVVGSQVLTSSDQQFWRIGLLSKLASVPSEHAGFSSHMSVNLDGKKVPCNCSSCSQHFSFHMLHSLDEIAQETAEITSRAGIYAPYTDMSDYCLGEHGGVTFFEIDKFDPAGVDAFITGRTDTRTARVKRLLERYRTI